MAEQDTQARTVHFELPPRIFAKIERRGEELDRMGLEALVLSLYQRGEVGGGLAADALGLTRREFIALLGDRRIPLIDYEPGELEAEFERLHDHAKREG